MLLVGTVRKVRTAAVGVLTNCEIAPGVLLVKTPTTAEPPHLLEGEFVSAHVCSDT